MSWRTQGEEYTVAYIGRCELIPLPLSLFDWADWVIYRLIDEYANLVGMCDPESKAFDDITDAHRDWLANELRELTKKFYEHAEIESYAYEIEHIWEVDRAGNVKGAGE